MYEGGVRKEDKNSEQALPTFKGSTPTQHRAHFGIVKAGGSLRSMQRRARKALVLSNISTAPREVVFGGGKIF
jgi:hypothetical protein